MSPTAVTTAERPSAPATLVLDDVTVAVLADGVPTEHHARALPGGLLALDVTAPAGTSLEIRLAVPLRDAVGFWHPTCGFERSLLPDWAGRLRTSLINGAAVGCLYEASGATLIAFAAEDPSVETDIVFGVSEEAKLFVVHLEVTAGPGPYTLLLAPRAPSTAAALRGLRARLKEAAPVAPLQVPAAGRTPVYSTWYTFGQNVTAAGVEHEARLAAELGCELLILDDGWQTGGRERGYAWAGDWSVDTAKFPDLAGHVATVKELGLGYLAWIAPLLIGPDSQQWSAMGTHAPLASPTAPGAYVLDPRDPAVGEHLVDVCVRTVRDYGLDGLKLDFLDDAAVYAGDGQGDIGAAMAHVLGTIRTALEALNPGTPPMLELRGPYLGHGMAAYGNLLRAKDCPADATANRVRTMDASLLSLGGAVHSDMLMWDPDGEPESAARQLLSVLHSVPQLSCRLAGLRPDHREALAFWLAQWRRLRPVLLDGELEPGRPDELYPMIRGAAGDAEAVVLHAERIVRIDPALRRRFDIINATAAGTVVLDLASGAAQARLTVYDTLGRIIDSRLAPLGAGPQLIGVPPSGLLTIDVPG
jgi:alpha-galactosidase